MYKNNSEVFNILSQARFGRMLVNKNDVYIGQSILTYGEYGWAEIELLEKLIIPDSIIVEAGANIGSHSVPLAQRVKNRGWVYCLEPQRITFQTLCANIALNQCTNVSCYWAGVSDQAGQLSILDIDPYLGYNFGSVTMNSQGEGLYVPTIKIDDYNLDRCDLIKADVEGMEVEVVKGALETIDKCRPTLYLEVESRREIFMSLYSLISSLEYDIWWHFPNLYNPNNYFSKKEDIFKVHSVNILCVPAEQNYNIASLKKIDGVDEWWTDLRNQEEPV